ncbi:MAG: NADase-type glycan-binding domain-containing protein [Prevotella sp.]
MENENNFLKKNWLTLLLVALLGGVCFMWMKDREDAKAKSETSTEKVDSAVSAKESVDSLAGTSAKVDSIPKEEVDSLKDAPIVKLRPSLIKGPACMVANTFESYYPRNVIDGNRSTAWGLESYQGSGGTFTFRMPCRRLDHIVVWNGNWGEMGAWEDNARVRRLTISKRNAAGETTEIGTFALSNRHQSQTLRFDFNAPETRDIETLIITASGKYRGILFQDLYIAELAFFGNK